MGGKCIPQTLAMEDFMMDQANKRQESTTWGHIFHMETLFVPQNCSGGHPAASWALLRTRCVQPHR